MELEWRRPNYQRDNYSISFGKTFDHDSYDRTDSYSRTERYIHPKTYYLSKPSSYSTGQTGTGDDICTVSSYKPPIIRPSSPFNYSDTRFLRKSSILSGSNDHFDKHNKYNKLDKLDKLDKQDKYEKTVIIKQEKEIGKHSYGIILCRVNANNAIEVLLVHKRCTFAFIDFVCGRYHRIEHKSSSKYYQFERKFSNMTTEELNYIDTLNYEMMWHKIWLNGDKESFAKMNARKVKFERLFSDKDKSLDDYISDVKDFKRTIRSVSRNNKLLWEIPKGKKSTPTESDTICAIREMEEESSITKNMYRIIPESKIIVKYKDEGYDYINTYFIAMLHCDRKTLRHCDEIIENPIINHETLEANWFTIEKIRMMGDTRLEKLMKPVFKIVKKFNKGVYNFNSIGLA